MSGAYLGSSPTEENLRWELQQSKIRIQQLEAEVAHLKEYKFLYEAAKIRLYKFMYESVYESISK